MYIHFDPVELFFGIALWTVIYLVCATIIVQFFKPFFPPFKRYARWLTAAIVVFVALVACAALPLFSLWAMGVYLGLAGLALIGLTVRWIRNRKAQRS